MKQFNFLILLFISLNSFSQSLNDFRVRNDGDWSNDTDVWQYFDGSMWQNTTNYPGESGISVNDVTIGGGYTVDISEDINDEFINSVTVGDESGLADTLVIDNTIELNTTLFIIAYDGFVTWDGNNVLELPTGTNFVVENPDPNPAGLVLGVSHGLDITPPGNGGCTSSKRIDIGTVKYSVCSGNANSVSFDFINNNGGFLNVTPTADLNPVCRNKNIQLMANPSGTESDTNTYSWVVTEPNGDTYSLANIEHPTDTPSGFGTYIYQVTIENNAGLTNTDTIEIEVESCKTIVTNRRITYRVTGVRVSDPLPVPTLQELPSNRYIVDRFTDMDNQTERLEFKIQNGFNFTELQILISDVVYPTLSVISASITSPAVDLLSTTSVISGNSASGTGYDHLIILTGTTFQGNRDVDIFFDTLSPTGSTFCNGTGCTLLTFYGN